MKMIMILGCLLQDTPILSSYLADKEKYIFFKAESKSTIFAAYKMSNQERPYYLNFRINGALHTHFHKVGDIGSTVVSSHMLQQGLTPF